MRWHVSFAFDCFDRPIRKSKSYSETSADNHRPSSTVTALGVEGRVAGISATTRAWTIPTIVAATTAASATTTAASATTIAAAGATGVPLRTMIMIIVLVSLAGALACCVS
jgi:hypothetical protein